MIQWPQMAFFLAESAEAVHNFCENRQKRRFFGFFESVDAVWSSGVK
jgi:hypothetical protein